MEKYIDIAVLQANIEPIKGKELYWAFSRKQVEHVVGDLEIPVAESEAAHFFGFFNWQGLELPIVSLEKFSQLKRRNFGESSRGVVVKTTVQSEEGVAARVILEANYRLSMVQVNASLKPVPVPQTEIEMRRLLGLYHWEENKYLMIPDLKRIVSDNATSPS